MSTVTAVTDRGPRPTGGRAGLTDCSDAQLLEQVRSGHDEAYGELYVRHQGAAARLARQLERSAAAADDLVSDAFAAVLGALHNGAGPTEAFRPYLLTAVRRRHWRRSRNPEDPTDPTDGSLDGAVLEADSEDGRLMIEAYRQLPERWQLVLWHTEVEGAPPAEVAPLVGLSPHATAALAHRAREGLREAYLQAHLRVDTPAGCRGTVTMMGALVRGNLGKRDHAKADAHLTTCTRCQGLRAEVADVNRALRSVVAPLVLGSAAAAYLARRAVTGPAATATIGHSARGSARRLVIVGTALAVTIGLLVARSDLHQRPPSAVGAAAPQPAVGSTPRGPVASAQTVALPGGFTVRSVPIAAGGSCAGSSVAVGSLATAADGEGGIVRAVLFRGGLGGLAPGAATGAITPVRGAALTTLQALAAPTPGTTPDSTGADRASAPVAPTCVSVATTTLLGATGTWHLLVGYVPTGTGGDDVQFAVLDQPFVLLGTITRTALTIAHTVLEAVVTALPGLADALSGQIDPADIVDLTTATAPLRSTVDDPLAALGSGTGSIVDATSGAGAVVDVPGTGGSVGGTSGPGTGGLTPPTGSGSGPAIPPVTVPGLPPNTLPPVSLPPLPPVSLPTLPVP